MKLLDKEILLSQLHVAGLWAIAICQPIYNLLASNAEFFIARNVSALDFYALVFFLSFALPALPIAAVVALSVYGREFRKPALGVVLFMLFFLFALVLLHNLGLDFFSFALATVLAGLLVFLYLRYENARSFFSVLSVAILVVPLIFVLGSGVRKSTGSETSEQQSLKSVENPVSPIILMIFDEFPVASIMDMSAQVDSKRFPNLAKLAAGSTWYRNATSVADRTVAAVPAILTGKYPDKTNYRHRLPLLEDYPDNLFTLLQDTHRIYAFEAVSKLSPVRLPSSVPMSRKKISARMGELLADIWLIYLHLSMPQNVSKKLPRIDRNWKDFRTQALEIEGDEKSVKYMLRRFAASLEENQGQTIESFINFVHDSDEPSLYFIHILFPHLPWQYMPSGKIYSTAGKTLYGLKGGDLWSKRKDLVAQNYRRHLLQVAYLDTLLGRLFDRLRDQGMYDEAVIVLTADHGIAFQMNKQRRVLRNNNFYDILAVPLFIKAPGQSKGEIVDRNVETIDILPTIAAHLKRKIPFAVDGQSLLQAPASPRSTKVGYQYFSNTALKEFRARGEFRPENFGLATRRELVPGLLQRPGGIAELIDQPVSNFKIAQGAMRFTIEQAGYFDKVELDSKIVLSHLRGTASKRTNLAVATNGTIRATGLPFLWNGKLTFSFVLPTGALVAGKNQIEIYSFEAAERVETLRKLKNVSK